ncbi:hypothetical protein Bbelb_216080 [Branchiostoma belcheri]|nr:hypothetical protein Bbelb_216080 [Branchiostoma belcheri]
MTNGSSGSHLERWSLLNRGRTFPVTLSLGVGGDRNPLPASGRSELAGSPSLLYLTLAMPGYYYHIKIPQTTRQGGSPRSGRDKDGKGKDKKDPKATADKERRRDTVRERSARAPPAENKSWWFPYEKKVHLMVFTAVGVICIILGLGRGLKLEERALGAVLFSFGLFVLVMIGVWLLKVYIVARRERKRKEEEGREGKEGRNHSNSVRDKAFEEALFGNHRCPPAVVLDPIVKPNQLLWSPNPVKAKRTYETLSAARLGKDRQARAEQSRALLMKSPSTITTSPESEDMPLPSEQTTPEAEAAPPPSYNEIVQA